MNHATRYRSKQNGSTGQAGNETKSNPFLGRAAAAIRHRPTYMQSTPFGNFRVYLPGQQSSSPPESHGLKQEARFTFTCGIGQSVHDIQAHFRRDWSSLSSPKLYTQLSVFTLAESEGEYDRLFACASAGEIDDALRMGVISPYHINREDRNLCLYVCSFFLRLPCNFMRSTD